MAQGVWAEARAKDDVAAFLPVLSDVVRLKREEGAALAEGGDPYDALMDDYEPGATAETVGALFGRMRPRLVALRERVLGAGRAVKPLEGSFGAEAQMRMARDLATAFERAWQRLAPYRRMGCSVLPLCLQPGSEQGLDELQQRLQGRCTLVLGPSGVGKSTLVNRLVPLAGAQTGEISKALNSGKHTTTSTTWYWVDQARETALIDSPGFQEFGLHHIEATQLASLMPDLRATMGDCRFYNCTHLHEPGCGVRAHVGADPQTDALAIGEHRYRLYGQFFEELSAPQRY